MDAVGADLHSCDSGEKKCTKKWWPNALDLEPEGGG